MSADFEPERVELRYFVRVLDPATKKWYTTRWRMNEETAKLTFGHTQYEIKWETKHEQVVGGDWTTKSTSSFLRK